MKMFRQLQAGAFRKKEDFEKIILGTPLIQKDNYHCDKVYTERVYINKGNKHLFIKKDTPINFKISPFEPLLISQEQTAKHATPRILHPQTFLDIISEKSPLHSLIQQKYDYVSRTYKLEANEYDPQTKIYKHVHNDHIVLFPKKGRAEASELDVLIGGKLENKQVSSVFIYTSINHVSAELGSPLVKIILDYWIEKGLIIIENELFSSPVKSTERYKQHFFIEGAVRTEIFKEMEEELRKYYQEELKTNLVQKTVQEQFTSTSVQK